MINEFYWLVEGELAGMAMPTAARAYAYLEDADKIAKEEFLYEISELKKRGVGSVVTLTETPLADGPLREAGIDYVHIPIPDMTAPTLSQIQHFVTHVHQSVQEQKPVVAHCLGGLGRTGTMLACYLVSKGYASTDAIKEVRQKRSCSIETLQQEESVIEYAVLTAKSSQTK